MLQTNIDSLFTLSCLMNPTGSLNGVFPGYIDSDKQFQYGE